LLRFLARSASFHYCYCFLLSKTNRTPLSLSRIEGGLNPVDLPNKVIVSVGTITDDIRLTEVPNHDHCPVFHLRVFRRSRTRLLPTVLLNGIPRAH
ncbi:hypothetical protein B0H14DRAFT_2498419, partial [Mycena olivaceomarginata]